MDRIQKRLVLVIFLLGMTILFISVVPLGEAVPLRMNLNMFPRKINHWIGQDVSLKEKSTPLKTPLNVDDYLYRRYQNSSGENIVFYIGYSGKFRYGDSIFLGDYVALSYDWKLLKEDEESKVINGNNISIKKAVFKRGKQCLSTSYWYQTNRGVVTDRDEGRFSRAFDAILNRRTNVALVRVSSGPQISQDCTFSADHDVFIKEMLPHLEKFLPFEF